MDLFADLHRCIADILPRLVARGVLPPGPDATAFSVAPAPAALACDARVDAALVYARGLDPCCPARLLAEEIAREPAVARAEVSGRGFIDVTWRPEVSGAALAALLNGCRSPPSSAPRRAWRHDWTLAEARSAAVDEALAALDAAAGRPPGSPARTGAVWSARCPGRPVPVGTAPTLREAADVCGSEALRFALAAAEPAKPLALDLDALADRWRGNPAFWVPYAHARARAALRRAASGRPDRDLSRSALAGAAFERLRHPADLHVMRAVLRTPRVVSGCAAARSARRLALHLADLADAVHARSCTSTDQPQSRFVNEEQRDLIEARLGLVAASTLVLESGLGILGLTAPDEML